MKIEQLFLAKNQFSRPGTLLKGVQGVVLHWVANPGTSALANRNYFDSLKTQNAEAKNTRYASAHFVIGLQGEIIQCLPETEVGYHVGAQKYTTLALAALGTYPNNDTLGIELCHPDWTGSFEKATLDAARELVVDLLSRHKLTVKNVYRHFDITGKDCPRYFVQNENEWKNFLETIG